MGSTQVNLKPMVPSWNDVSLSQDEFAEEMSRLPEFIEMERLAKELGEIKKKLPSLGNPILTKDKMELWDQYIEKEDRYNELLPKLLEKRRRLLKEYQLG